MNRKKTQNVTRSRTAVAGIIDDGAKLCQEALDAVEDAVHVVDADFRLLILNRTTRKWCRALKIPLDSVIGKTVFETFPFLPKHVELEYQKVKKTGKPLKNEEERTIIGRREIITESVKIPLLSNRRVTHIVTILRDITARKDAETRLRASEREYRNLRENVHASIAVVDQKGIFQFVNHLAAMHVGLRPDKIVGRTQWDVFPKKVADRQMKNIRNVIDKGITHTEEAKTYLKGSWRWFNVTVQPYMDSDGNISAAMVIANDITERKKVEKELRESETRFRSQFQSIPVPTYIWKQVDDDFELIDYNRGAEVITRGNISSFLGSKAGQLYAAMPQIVRDMKRCVARKTTITREMVYPFRSFPTEKYFQVYYVSIPPDLILVHTVDLTERKVAEAALQKAHDELEERVRERTRELAEANEALRVEREALRQKNIALREILDQIEDTKRQMASQIQSNINRIALPILNTLQAKTPPAVASFVDLLRNTLEDIASPLAQKLEDWCSGLTPRELEICHMIKNGVRSKEIAATLNTSVQTVLKQRAAIRKKLGITNQNINLVSFLKSL